MRVSDLMQAPIPTCLPSEDLRAVIDRMSSTEAGMAAVVDSEGRAIAVVTERDVLLATHTRRSALQHIQVHEVAARGVIACEPGDAVREALSRMREHSVRRLAVLDPLGRPVGLISADDIVSAADTLREMATDEDEPLDMAEVAATFKRLTSRSLRRPTVSHRQASTRRAHRFATQG